MVRRWTALGVVTAQKKFRRIKGYRHMGALVHALRSKQKSLDTMSLLPKSIHRCRRYPTKFNSGRDIPSPGTRSLPFGVTFFDLALSHRGQLLLKLGGVPKIAFRRASGTFAGPLTGSGRDHLEEGALRNGESRSGAASRKAAVDRDTARLSRYALPGYRRSPGMPSRHLEGQFLFCGSESQESHDRECRDKEKARQNQRGGWWKRIGSSGI